MGWAFNQELKENGMQDMYNTRSSLFVRTFAQSLLVHVYARALKAYHIDSALTMYGAL